ncbi:MAG: hypothetical protein V4619_15395 [Bacteroidota bacterium]
MKWDKLKEQIYFIDGSLRDIYICETTKDDWKKWIKYVNATYAIKWLNGKTNESEDQINFDIVSEYLDGNSDWLTSATIFVGSFQIKSHFFVDSEIENDIDPKEFNSIDDHNNLVKYITDISMLLNKEVLITVENLQENILLKIIGDKVILCQ